MRSAYVVLVSKGFSSAFSASCTPLSGRAPLAATEGGPVKRSVARISGQEDLRTLNVLQLNRFSSDNLNALYCNM